MKNQESLADLELESNCLYCNNLDLRLIEEELQIGDARSENPLVMPMEFQAADFHSSLQPREIDAVVAGSERQSAKSETNLTHGA
jgi:hypothetical protein